MSISSARANAWQRVERLLLVRLDNLGDVLMTTPAFRACAAPGRRLTLLASAGGAAISGHVDSVDEVIVHAASWVKGTAPDVPHAGHDRRLVAALRRGRFDAAIVFTVCTQSALPAALICRLAGIPLRLAHVRENPYALLTDWVPDADTVRDGMRHEVRRQLDLVGSVGYRCRDDRLALRFSANDARGAAQRLAAAGGDPNRPYVLVHVGSSASSRRYPAARFGAAAHRLRQQTGMQIVFCGGTAEAEQVGAAVEAMEAASPHQAPGACVALAGGLQLGELAALIGAAQVVVCNNSGPAHIAAACGTPVVVTYAQTNPQHTPWKVPSRVLSRDVPCRNCLKSRCPFLDHPCLLGIDEHEVAGAALELLAESASRTAA